MIGQGAAEFPFAAAGVGAVIEAVPILPARIFFRFVAGPDDLRVGPDEGDFAPAFVLQAIAGIEPAATTNGLVSPRR